MQVSDEKRQIILQAAIKVFSERGFEKATVDEIAERAGIAKGTVYYHFASKKQLFLALIEDGVDRMDQVLRAETTGCNTLKEVLTRVIAVEIDFVKEYKDYSKVFLSEVWGLENYWQKEAEHVRARLIGFLKEALAKGRDRGELKPGLNLTAVATSLYGMVFVTGLYFFIFEQDFAYNELVNSIQELFLYGALDHTPQA